MAGANTRQGSTTGGYSGSPMITSYISRVTGLYLTMGLGTALTLFLFITFVGGMGTPNLGGGLGLGARSLTGVVTLSWVLLVFFGPILTAGVAFAVGRTTNSGAAGAVAGALSNVVGVLVTLIVLVFLLILVAPGGGSMARGLGRLFLALVGVGIGVGITGAAGGALGAGSRRW